MLLFRLLFLAALVAHALPACDTLSGPTPPSAPTTLDEAQAQWAANGFAAYRYRFERTCFCSPAHLSARVTVRGDTVAALDDVRANGTPIQDTHHIVDRDMTRSIEQLFDIIRAAERTTIDSVAVTYDARYGHPKTLFVDPLQAMSSEDITYEAHDITAIDSLANN